MPLEWRFLRYGRKGFKKPEKGKMDNTQEHVLTKVKIENDRIAIIEGK